MKILFFIRDLDAGGAQRQLVSLASTLNNQEHDIHVAIFYGNGIFQNQLEDTGVKIHNLEKKGRWDLFGFLKKYISLVKNISPDVILCYLPVANIISAICRPFSPKKTKIVFGVRASYMDPKKYELLAAIILKIEAWLSRFADLIICNSHAGWENSKKMGFKTDKMITIHNGIDTMIYYPDRDLGIKWRDKWTKGKPLKIIGLIGRLDPKKDHRTFLEAAAILSKKYTDLLFVCVGNGSESYKKDLIKYSTGLGIEEKVIWLPAQSDMNSIYNALDICCLSSAYGEGFPNVIGEAMACNIPCVATNTGDSSIIIDNPERIAPPKDPQALAEKLEACYNEKGSGQKACPRACDPRTVLTPTQPDYRTTIINKFSVDKLAGNTRQALNNL